MQPQQLNYYKGAGGKAGALQLNFQPPHYYVKKLDPSDPKKYRKLKNYIGKFVPPAWKQDYPELTSDDLESREGAIFMEITSATGRNIYDWENKIRMALSITDMGKILAVLEGMAPGCKIYHDPGAKSSSAGKIGKSLEVTSPQGIKTGVIFTCSQTNKDDSTTRKHMVPLSGDEVAVLRACIRQAIPASLGWK